MPRFPAVERDLAIVVPDATPALDVERPVRTHAGELLREFRLFDIYRGAPLGGDEKSLAYRVDVPGAGPDADRGRGRPAVRSIVAALGATGGRLRG